MSATSKDPPEVVEDLRVALNLESRLLEAATLLAGDQGAVGDTGSPLGSSQCLD